MPKLLRVLVWFAGWYNLIYKHTFQARFVVVVPTKWYSRPALRLELYGCSVSGPPASMGTNVTEDIEVSGFVTSFMYGDQANSFECCIRLSDVHTCMHMTRLFLSF